MIPFFRKTRKKMADDNKPMKYLRYAIGEILLVVIGILIALSINNWNEERKERKIEKQLLISLSEDFKSNLSNLENSIKLIPITNERYSRVLEYAGNIDNGLTKEMKDTIVMTSFVLTTLVDGALNSALNSNKLEIIRNDTLKRWLTKYPAYIENIKIIESDLKDYVKDVQRPIVRSYVSLDILLEEPRFDQLKETISKSDYEGLIRNREYLNVVMGIRNIKYHQLNRCKDLHWVTNEINEILKREIKD
jgi:hypothetical protein